MNCTISLTMRLCRSWVVVASVIMGLWRWNHLDWVVVCERGFFNVVLFYFWSVILLTTTFCANGHLSRLYVSYVFTELHWLSCCTASSIKENYILSIGAYCTFFACPCCTPEKSTMYSAILRVFRCGLDRLFIHVGNPKLNSLLYRTASSNQMHCIFLELRTASVFACTCSSTWHGRGMGGLPSPLFWCGTYLKVDFFRMRFLNTRVVFEFNFFTNYVYFILFYSLDFIFLHRELHHVPFDVVHLI